MKTNKIIGMLLLTTSLVACQGSNPSPTYTPPPAPPAPAPTPQAAPPPAPSTHPAITVWRTTEFNRSWGLGAIRAEHAYAEGFNGAGQIIGFVDFNFDLLSSDVIYSGLSKDKDPANIAIYEAQIDDVVDTSPHGHAVAVVAAGVRDGFDTHGVAYGAQVLGVDYFSGVYNEDVEQDGKLYHVSDPYTYLVDNGARVVNISIGYDEEDFYSDPPVDGGGGDGGGGTPPPMPERYVTTHPSTVIELGQLLVAAAGNDGDPEPMVSNLEILDNMNNLNLLGAFLIVGSVDENLNISSFSDRAGRAMNNYLVAPGDGVVAPWDTVDEGPGLYYVGGTSFAAPHVAGAAAILFSRWDFLTAKEVAEILLTTATDLGDLGVDAIYGHGLLNLENAISPQGEVVAAIIGASAPVGLDGFGLVMGTAFGNATPKGLSNLMGQDKYGRDFYFDLSSGIYDLASNNRPLFEFFEQGRKGHFEQLAFGKNSFGLQIAKDHEDGFMQTQSQFVKDHVSEQRVTSGILAGQINQNWQWKLGFGAGLSNSLSQSAGGFRLLSTSANEGYFSSRGSFGLLEHNINSNLKLSFAVDVSKNQGLAGHFDDSMREDLPKTALTMQIAHQDKASNHALRFGQLLEQGSVLGSRSFGGFAVASEARTSFLGLNNSWQLNNGFSLHTDITGGVTSVSEAGGSFFEGFNDFFSSAWKLELRANDIGLKNSRFVLSASQPLRVENATITRHRAVGVNHITRAPIYEQVTTQFSPTGREIAFEAAYVLEGADRTSSWSLQASLMHRLDAGHANGVSDTAGLLWLKRRF